MPQNYDKLEYNRLQHELAKINKKIRGFWVEIKWMNVGHMI
jgi:hypothetical protein